MPTCLYPSWGVMEPPLLGNAVDWLRGLRGILETTDNMPSSNLPQANTGITREIQNTVYLTCNLKELTVLAPPQANTLCFTNLISLYFHGKSVRRRLGCRTATVYRHWGLKSSPRLTPIAEF